MTEAVTVFEVGPRDGLQNEPVLISTSDKIHLVNLLSKAGMTRIETSAFVSPKRVPQMADAMDVFAGIERAPGTRYTALTPNMQGFEGALRAGVDEVAVFGAASETFSQRNINCSIAESLARFEPVLSAAKDHGIPVRGYISCVTDCPFEGKIAPETVAKLAVDLLAMGCAEISLGDTIGHGTPERVDRLLSVVLNDIPAEQLAGHFHDTKGFAAANIEVSLTHGLRIFDAAAGGLGGCPFAPGAAGNVASEKVVKLLEAAGYTTGIDQIALSHAAEFAKSFRKPPK